MGNGRGIWNQYHRDSIRDKAEAIEELEKKLTLQEPKKITSWLDYLKPSFYKKKEDINIEDEKEIKKNTKSKKVYKIR